MEIYRPGINSDSGKYKLIPYNRISEKVLSKIKVIAADIDDTLTIRGRLTTSVIDKLMLLKKRGFSIILVTGRATGWGQALVNYCEFIDYLISENGLVLVDNQACLHNIFDAEPGYQEELAINSERIRKQFNLIYTKESGFSLFENSFIRPTGFLLEDLKQCNDIVGDNMEVIASSIHIHIRPEKPNKGDALLQLLNKYYPALENKNVMTIGDSPSDGPLFNNFQISVGVANVLEFKDELGCDLPGYITTNREGYGLIEIISRLLALP